MDYQTEKELKSLRQKERYRQKKANSGLRRKIRLAGFSLPVWAYLLFGGVLVAAAAFLFSLSTSVSITASDGIQVTAETITCSITGAGTVDTCVLNGDGTASVAVSGADNESLITVRQALWNQDTQDALLSWSAVSPPAAVSSITCAETATLGACDGFVITAGTEPSFETVIELGNLTPSETVPAFEYLFEADYN